MKILLIECTAEELRANRTVMDSVTEAISSFTRSFAGFDVTPEMLSQMDEEDTDEVSGELDNC